MSFHSRLFFRIISKSGEVYFLKIITLAIAFACSTLIILFSLNEFGYDRFHRDFNSVFRILKRNNNEGYSGNRLSNKIPVEVFLDLQLKSSDSIVVARTKVMDGMSILAEGQIRHNQKIHAADPVITNILTFDILDGSLKEFHKKEHTILLSSSVAEKYFGTVQAAGKDLKIFTLGDTVHFSVAGVYKDYPKNSHEEFGCFIRFDTSSIQSLRFSHLDAGVYAKVLQGKKAFFEKEINSLFSGADLVYKFQPVSEVYFGPRVLGEDAKHGDHYSIVILISITALIFFLALTNFINLTTLTLPHRSKELAVKKLAGTSQSDLLFSFAKESFSIVGISLVMGLLILVLISDLIEPVLSLSLISLLIEGDVVLILILLGLFVILGIAPLFMTFKFTSATPNRLLSSDTITFPRFKRIITFLQLGISIFLIVASMVIMRQVNYSLIKEPGRNHDQIVYMRYPSGLTNEGLRNLRLTWKNNIANIIDVMATSQMPDQITSKELDSDFYFMSVDPEFRDFFDLNMLHGNWFKANDGDSIVVVNELGKKILGRDQHFVIGIFEDLSKQFNKPEKPIKINISSDANYNFLCVRILEVDIRKTLGYLSAYFEQGTLTPGISFLDKRFNEWILYQDRLNAVSKILAIISGILSCLAIYGLSVSIVRDKLKQIAIHKLCGATTLNITRLLVKEFAHQMFFAVLIFGPITYLIIKESLRSFVYATHFAWLDPLIPLAYCAIVITLLCGFQALSLNRVDLSSALRR